MVTKKTPEHRLKYLFSQPIHPTASNDKGVNEKSVSGNLQTEERVTFTRHTVCNRVLPAPHRQHVSLSILFKWTQGLKLKC